MADVFVSYARNDKARVAPLVAAIEAKGWSVWWDPEITPGQQFDDQIDAEIAAALAVLVVWTPASVASRWVRGEAREAAERGILVPVRFDQARLPMDVRAIHTTDLDGWGDNAATPPARNSCGAGRPNCSAQASRPRSPGARLFVGVRQGCPALTICVLPFVNMSGDPEQEYFSDGITEDIITDLSKVSALGVVARNTAFIVQGQNVDVAQVARQLKVSHVLEGSVRKCRRPRPDHGAADRRQQRATSGPSASTATSTTSSRSRTRFPRRSSTALKLSLLPEEKKAIEQRGTSNAEAYNLYLMARQTYITGQEYDPRSAEAIIRLCARATEIDPHYSQAWALMAIGHIKLREASGGSVDNGMAAVERALAIDPHSAEAHAIKGQILLSESEPEAAAAAVATALELDPESYEVNRSAGRLNYQLKRHAEAIRYYEKAATLMEADLSSASVLMSSYTALGDVEGMRRSAKRALNRAEAILAHDPNNSMVAGYSAYALCALGDAERAKARMERALLIDPKNFNMRYNFACALSVYLKDKRAALDMLGPVFETITETFLPYVKIDPDLDLLRDDPQFAAQLATSEARLAANARQHTIGAT